MSAAHKSESPAATGLNANQTTNVREFTPVPARMAARAAKAGAQIHAFDDQDGKTVYIVSRWGMSRQLDSIEAAESWLDMVLGVPHG